MLVAPVARTSRASSVFSGGMSPTTEPRGARAGDDDLLVVAVSSSVCATAVRLRAARARSAGRRRCGRGAVAGVRRRGLLGERAATGAREVAALPSSIERLIMWAPLIGAN